MADIGNWKLITPDKSLSGLYQIVDERGDVIVEFHPDFMRAEEYAHLIAAAPELARKAAELEAKVARYQSALRNIADNTKSPGPDPAWKVDMVNHIATSILDEEGDDHAA